MDQKTPSNDISPRSRGRAPKKMRAQPLYQQVDNTIRQRLIGNVWEPGEAIPSEMQLAAEMNVSQGTVRKALGAMESDNLVTRRQGRGTFVAEHDLDRALFHFFHMVGEGTAPRFFCMNIGDSPVRGMNRSSMSSLFQSSMTSWSAPVICVGMPEVLVMSLK